MNSEFPTLVLLSFSQADDRLEPLIVKCCVSSILRSLFTGNIVIIRNRQEPLYLVERANVTEISLGAVSEDYSAKSIGLAWTQWVPEITSYVTAGLDQWVIFCSLGGLALRNIDHLFPPVSPSKFPGVLPQFLYLQDAEGNISEKFWAVRGRALREILALWKISIGCKDLAAGAAASRWTHGIREMGIPIRQFEKGEVTNVILHETNWLEITEAAFVITSAEDRSRQLRLFQTLYLGSYLGDETGLVMGIIDT